MDKRSNFKITNNNGWCLKENVFKTDQASFEKFNIIDRPILKKTDKLG